jgi:predicted kinase
MLVIFGGRSGTGKTTIARVLSSRLGATYLRIDTIEQALRGSGELKADVGAAGYLIAYALAEDKLRAGGIVIADSVNPLQITRAAWLAVAERVEVPAVEVELVCSDAERHRQRVETRTIDIAGLRPPTWAEVTERRWEPWERSHIIIDTASKTVDEAVAGLLDDLRVRAGIG